MYDFRKLSGKIKEKCGTQEEFARLLNISPQALGNKLKGKTPFKVVEIDKACLILDIDSSEIPLYFFKKTVQ